MQTESIRLPTLSTAVALLVLAAACGSDPAAPPTPAGLRVYLGLTPNSATSISFSGAGQSLPLSARLIGADSTPIGDALAAQWTSRDPGVAAVRDTTVSEAGARGPGAWLTSRGLGRTAVEATVVVGGRVLRGTLPVEVVPNASR